MINVTFKGYSLYKLSDKAELADKSGFCTAHLSNYPNDRVSFGSSVGEADDPYEFSASDMYKKVDEKLISVLEDLHGKGFADEESFFGIDIQKGIQEELIENKLYKGVEKENINESKELQENVDKIITALDLENDYEWAKGAVNASFSSEFTNSLSNTAQKQDTEQIGPDEQALIETLRLTPSGKNLSRRDFLKTVLLETINDIVKPEEILNKVEKVDKYSRFEKANNSVQLGEQELLEILTRQKQAIRVAYLLNAIIPDPEEAKHMYYRVFTQVKGICKDVSERNKYANNEKINNALSEFNTFFDKNCPSSKFDNNPGIDLRKDRS